MQISDLVLLVGTNPLPNYVVADYLISNYEHLNRIFLVYSAKSKYSEGTRSYANNLESLLKTKKSNHSMQFEFVELQDVGNDILIAQDIQKILLKKTSENTHLHLNYTGGTKAMVTHVYQTLKLHEKQLASLTFSYLDARHFKLRYDQSADLDSNDLRECVKLSFEELIQLHGFEKKSGKEAHGSIDYPDTIEKFRTAIEQNDLDNYWDTTHGFKRDKFLNLKKNLVDKPSEIDPENFETFTASGLFLDVVRSMPKPLFTSDGHYDHALEITNKEFKNTIKFLAGNWLEDYVFACLKARLQQDIWNGWFIKKQNWSTDFELDVIFLKGYQLIAISCTTDKNKSICKSKGFEILLRSKQIGGDEARAILVCGADEKTTNQLQQELITDSGSQANILVLGQEDLKPNTLVDKILEFIGDDI